MRFENVCIESLGYHLPDNVVTSEDLERRLAPLYDKLKLPYGRLEMMSGIRERRFFEKGVFPSQVASLAGEQALSKTRIDRKNIGCLINGSVCRDFLEPATASVIHHNLKLPSESLVFDISNACLGVMNGMVHTANMIEAGQIQAGLIVAGENGGPLVETTLETLLADPHPSRAKIKSAFASLTIGSAAVAVLLVHRDLSSRGHRLLGAVARAETRFNELCQGNQDMGMGEDSSPLMETDSETLMKEGCLLAKRTWAAARSSFDWENEDVNRIFCHQVGHMQRKLLYETLELDLEKDFSTLEYLGNTGSAALPVTLAMGEEKDAVRQGDTVALLGIGSGLNCLMMGVEW
ncbi:MAG: 3-oxoacyl-ACP synthase III [Nitrospinaceae bacterium]|nr:3-oxoacyl-ACP synthase III [Nitrospinaceae bacterium]NIX37354.1 3-oxoacyl-ACP synthase III [Nitrospinaceae bacterium]